MKKAIIDTDIGLGTRNAEIEDGLAISFAFTMQKELRVEGITTVFGNVVGGEAYKNAVNLLGVLGETSNKVAKGAIKPLKDQSKGEPSAKAAAELITSIVLKQPKEITLICIGPLTNIATALIMEPDLPENVKEVYIMGGAVTVPGNVSPTAEFNIYSDPVAAKIVFNSKMPITLIPLDVTTKTLFTDKHLEILRSTGGKTLDHICQYVEPWLNLQKQTFKLEGGNLHDPLAVAIAVDNTLAKMEKVFVDVETKGEVTRGMTVAERRTFMKSRTKNMKVCLNVDEPRFMRIFLNAMRMLAKR
nr:nucleoside hydrolase [Candidatus Njordarchaeum guaymaensis]